MNETKFSYKSLVKIEINAGKADRRKQGNNFILKFLNFQIDNDIRPVHTLFCGPNSYCGFFAPEIAEKIRAWLSEQGAEFIADSS